MDNGQDKVSKKVNAKQITFKLEHEKIQKFRSDLSVHQFCKDIVCQVVEDDYKPNHHILDLLPEKVVRQYAIDKLKLVTKQFEQKEEEENVQSPAEEEQFVSKQKEEKPKTNWVLRIFLIVGVLGLLYFLWQRHGQTTKGLLTHGNLANRK